MGGLPYEILNIQIMYVIRPIHITDGVKIGNGIGAGLLIRRILYGYGVGTVSTMDRIGLMEVL